MKKFDINSLKPIEVKAEKKLFKNDSVEFLRNRKNIAEALALAILDGDNEAFHDIITGYLGVVNKEELSRRSEVPIATIRRIAAGSNFNIENMLKITAAINKEIAA